ncbi:MAG: carboxypeptidase-like regulatory domain-containing protein, partial [Bacteroidota bacterium]
MKYLFHERAAYCWLRKCILIMRMTIFLILIGCLHAGAKGFSQTVNLSVSNMPLDRVCKEIEKQTGYYFVYAKDLKEKGHLISVEIKRATVVEALHKVFEGLPFTWQVIDKVVVVNTISQIDNGMAISPNGEPIDIKGRVINVQGEPLVNASVISKKTKKATGTGANGEFILKGLPLDDELMISYIGYKSQTIKVTNRTSLTMTMEIADNELDKTVVQAYGKTTQRLTTSNIGVITAAEIERQPVMNPLLALQGKVAGLDISQTNGYASAPIKVELRGRSAIGNFPSDPLYIIDGVPLTVVDVSGSSNYL